MDANVLIAALIRDSTTRRLLVLGGHELHAPEYVFEEIADHWPELAPRSGLAPDALREVLEVLRGHVREHPVAEYEGNLDAAIRLLKERDPDDAPYIALVLTLRADALWSEDRRLSPVEGVRVVRTRELASTTP